MKKEVYLTILYDYYSELLKPLEKEIFKGYYFDNLSLGELSDAFDVSRNAIHKRLKSIDEKLCFYEEKLGLKKKEDKILEIIKKIEDENLKHEIEELLE